MAAVSGDEREAAAIDALRRAGARFAFVHGSRAWGGPVATSDLDVGAWWAGRAPATWDVAMPDDVDLVVLDDRTPLELAGRIARRGRLLFDDDPPARVIWTATTRKLYADEAPRMAESRRTFLEARASGR